MARHISVYKKTDLNFIKSSPHNVSSDEFDRWCAECDARCLYDESLGSESAVREFWPHPAAMLGLTLIADIYGRGFTEGIEWSEAQLNQAEQELVLLEKHWSGLNLDDELIDYLKARLGYLREAIAIAREQDGVIMI